jgi:Uma2 family endonuclease
MTELIEQHILEEYQDMGSLNHSFIQARLARLLPEDNFTIMIELSLDISQTDLSSFGLKVKEELKPDVSLYKGSYQPNPLEDIVKMSEMPSLVIEILSPTQGFSDILPKFKAYFALGVKSGWLVTPALESIAVYSAESHKNQSYKSFDMTHDTEVVDKVLDIHLPLQKIFRK